MRRNPLLILALAAVLLAAGCGDFGTVEQGLVVAATGDQLTLILDSDPGGAPVYDRLPPVTVRVPQDPSQMGPAPSAGGLIQLDTAAGKVTVFVAASQKLETIPVEVLERQGDVYPDSPAVAEAHVPVIDKAAKTVKLYSPRTREMVTLSVPEQYLDLSAETWTAGDEVRYYFKDPGQALRMMNVSDTEIS